MQQFIENYRRDIIGVLCRVVRSRAGLALSNDERCGNRCSAKA
jgi:hypothetical protein